MRGLTSPGPGNSIEVPKTLGDGFAERQRVESSGIVESAPPNSFVIVSEASPPANVEDTLKKIPRIPVIFDRKLATTGGLTPPSNTGPITSSRREIVSSAVGGLVSTSRPTLDLVMN